MTRKEFLKITSAAAGSAIGAAVQRADADVAGPGARARTPDAQPNGKHTFPSGVTAAVVAFIEQSSFATFPEKAVVEARRCLIDGFGVVLAGSTVRGSAIVRDYVRSLGEQAHSGSSDAGAAILGSERLRASAARAALANGASGHAMDYDDTQLSSSPDRVFGLLTHPTVPVLAASLALGEQVNATGRAFLEAFLIGFEIECKVAEAIKPDHYLRGFHST